MNLRQLVSRESPAIFLLNRAAGGGRAEAHADHARNALHEAGVESEWRFTASAEEMRESACEAIRQGRKVLIAAGGDGTFHVLVNAAFGKDVIVGVLPLGGGNDFAMTLGFPKDPATAARALALASPKAVDVIRVRTSDGSERIYVGGGGIGLDAETVRHANERFQRWPGRLRYIAGALRALRNFRRPEVRVEFPDADVPALEEIVLLASVLNTPTYGGGLRLAPEARLDDGRADLVLVGDLSPFEVIRLLPRLLWSGELRTKRLKRYPVKQVRLSAKESCAFHGDGEIIGTTPIELEVLPSAMQVFAPQRES